MLIFLTTENAFALTGGGSIQGGGGGNFSAALFWRYTDDIKSRLDEKAFASPLTPQQRESILALLDDSVVQLKTSEKPLFVKDERGVDTQVDAVNFPDEKIIILYVPAWQRFFSSGLEIRHLILHEFLGLARVADIRYSISSRIFVPMNNPIPFQWNKVICGVQGYLLYHSPTRYNMQQTFGDGHRPARDASPTVVFPKPIRMGLTEGKDQSRMIKRASMKLDFNINEKYWENPPVLPQLSVQLDFIFGADFQNYGWGGAANGTFSNNSDFSLLAQVTTTDPNTKASSVLMAHLHEADKLDSDGNLAMNFTMINPQLLGALSNAGIRIQPAASAPVGQYLFNAHNVSALLQDYARAHGAQGDKEIDAYLAKTIFKNLPAATPIYISVECHLFEN